MKFLFVMFISLFQFSPIYSAEISKRAVVRDENFNAIIKDVTLLDLTKDNAYEGKYFKIVKGKDSSAIRFDDNEDLQLKAATTYYHMNKARKFFSEIVKSKYVNELPQITIRLDLINVFNEIGHFANENLDPQFNNALTSPAGNGYEPKNIKPWGLEVWFRPSKLINLADFKGSVDYGGSVKGSLEAFRNQTHMSNLQNFIISYLNFCY